MGKKKILVVDDSPTIIFFLKMMLSKNYHIVEAVNGKKGLEAAKKEKPDLILMDIMMPEMDGIEALEAMRASDEVKETPIIMVTTKGDQERVDTCFKLGCSDFVTKPIDKMELLTKVKKYLNE